MNSMLWQQCDILWKPTGFSCWRESCFHCAVFASAVRKPTITTNSKVVCSVRCSCSAKSRLVKCVAGSENVAIRCIARQQDGYVSNLVSGLLSQPCCCEISFYPSHVSCITNMATLVFLISHGIQSLLSLLLKRLQHRRE